MRSFTPDIRNCKKGPPYPVPLIGYGIDLTPLFHIQSHLEALAEDCRHETLRIKVLRGLIRDVLFKTPPHEITDIQNQAQRALRRVLDSNQLQKILSQLEKAAPVMIPQFTDNVTLPTTHLFVSDGQNDRHIQSSYKDNLESERAESETLSNPVLAGAAANGAVAWCAPDTTTAEARAVVMEASHPGRPQLARGTQTLLPRLALRP